MQCVAKISTKKDTTIQFAVTQDEWKYKWEKPTLVYDVIGTCRTMDDHSVKTAINYATEAWEVESGIKCVSGWGNANADVRIDFRNSEQDELFKKEAGVLAYAYFPQTSKQGRMVFNNDYIWSNLGASIPAKIAVEKGWIEKAANPNSSIKTYSIVAVLTHELGHMLGLTHDVSGNSDGVDVMDPYYSGVSRLELSDRDIARIHAKYGDRVYKNKGDYERLKNALKLAKLRLK